MMKATNFVVFDKSFQASSLGDASLISIVGTIQVLLGVLEELLRQQRRERRRKSTLLNGYIKQKRRSLISLCNEYSNLFDRAYCMDYASFQRLHEILKDRWDSSLHQTKRQQSELLTKPKFLRTQWKYYN